MALLGVALSQGIEWLRRRREHREEQERFISGRWWERRAEAYARVSEHLAEIRVALRDSIDELQGLEKATTSSDHIERWDRAEGKLALIVNQATLFLSAGALDCLSRIQSQLHGIYENVPQPPEVLPFLEEVARAFKRGTEEFAQLAREDLKVADR